jgi:hypothetical protein
MIAATTGFGIHISSRLEARAAGSRWTGAQASRHRIRAIDLIGQYEDAGIELAIVRDRASDAETRELFVSM